MLTLDKFEEASEIVKKVTQETSLVYSEYFSQQTGNKVYLKPENMQVTGAYKIRGSLLQDQYLKPGRAGKGGWITASPANHAQGGGLRGQGFRGEGGDRYAHHHSPHQGGADQELRSGGGPVRRCVR